jgi:hypothetical protein
MQRVTKSWVMGFVLLVACAQNEISIKPLDVTAKLESLGNPAMAQPAFSRNIWDLQVFDRRLFIGTGDAWRNTGPIPVISYNGQRFETEFTLDEEQIYNFVVTNDQLLIPGTDPREDWSLGNFYRLEPRCLAPKPCWSKTRSIPYGVHTYDLLQEGSRLYATIGGWDDPPEPGLLESEDGGVTWRPATSPELMGLIFTKLFRFGDHIYAAQAVQSDTSTTGLARLEDGLFKNAGIAGEKLLPGMDATKKRLKRLTTHNNRLYYLATSGGDNANFASAAFTGSSFDDITQIPLGPNEKPTDFLAHDSSISLLTTEATANGYTNRVYTSSHSSRFALQFTFETRSFARSLEFYEGAWYFGLGCLETESCDEAGMMLKLGEALER